MNASAPGKKPPAAKNVWRDRAIAKLRVQLDAVREDHETNIEAIENARAELDKQADAETARWDAIKEPLETSLRRARSHRLGPEFSRASPGSKRL